MAVTWKKLSYSDHVHSAATTSVDGFMSAADKTKLDGVAANANNYSHPTGNGNLHVPANEIYHANAILTAGANAGEVAWGANNGTSVVAPLEMFESTANWIHNVAVSLPAADAVDQNGYMSFADKAKLDGAFVAGTFTPSLAFGGNSVGITYSNITGVHKVLFDTVVFFQIYVALTSKGSSTGTVTFGLPFTSAGSNYGSISEAAAIAGLTFTSPLFSLVPASQALVRLYDNNSGTMRWLTDTAFTNTTQIRLSGFYYK